MSALTPPEGTTTDVTLNGRKVGTVRSFGYAAHAIGDAPNLLVTLDITDPAVIAAVTIGLPFAYTLAPVPAVPAAVEAPAHIIDRDGDVWEAAGRDGMFALRVYGSLHYAPKTTTRVSFSLHDVITRFGPIS